MSRNGIIRTYLNQYHDKEGEYMKNTWLFALYACLLAVVSIITGEIITYIMLGFILISLTNIHKTLKALLVETKRKHADTDNRDTSNEKA